MKVLVVDDSRSFITEIAVLLRKMGFKKTVLAESGAEAMRIMRLITPDVVIMDAVMPDMDGIAALKIIKSAPATSHIPVILVADSKSKNRVIKGCKKHGCAGWITKPVDITRLYDLLQDCITHASGEKRHNLRTTYRVRASVSHAAGAETLMTETLSEGGMFLKRKPPLDVGTELTLRLPMPTGGPMLISAVVIYTEGYPGANAGGTSPSGMAVRFDELSDEDIDRLRLCVRGVITGRFRQISNKSPKRS